MQNVDVHTLQAYLIALGLFFIVFAYCHHIWVIHGRKIFKIKSNLNPDPPQDLSVVMTACLNDGVYEPDINMLSASIIDLATKGYIDINDYEGKISLTRTDFDPSLSNSLAPEYKQLLIDLFSEHKTVSLTNEGILELSQAWQSFENKIKPELENNFFTYNTKYVKTSVLLSIISSVVYIIFCGHPKIATISIFFTVFISFCLFCLFGAAYFWIVYLFRLRQTDYDVFTISVVIVVWCITVILPTISLVLFLGPSTLLTIALILLNVKFYDFLVVPTAFGTKAETELKGYLKYLNKEKQQIDKSEFEKNLGYAVTLQLEYEWSRKFTDNMELSELKNYNPSWYQGDNLWTYEINIFYTKLGERFNEAIGKVLDLRSGYKIHFKNQKNQKNL